MKAVVYENYGDASQLSLRELPTPLPADGEVLVKVHAVSLNDWDWQLLQGIPFANRIINGMFRPKQQILGSDVAGTVKAVGRGVTRFEPGDAVHGDLSERWGGFAEYVCAQEKSLVAKPEGMDFLTAAAIPQAGVLAVQALVDTGRLETAKRILINGAGGGVGTIGIQIAKQYDVEVTGVDSGAKLEMLRAQGFDHVIDYQKEDFTQCPDRYDLIVDTKTNRPSSHYTRALSPGGLYATVGGDTARLLQIVVAAPLVRAATGKQLKVVLLKQNKGLSYLNDMFTARKLTAVVDGPFRLEELPEAMRYYGDGKQKGKVVIAVAG
jgi:NADPH:quinone reductase-like Zn-dependent oxidoreductase